MTTNPDQYDQHSNVMDVETPPAAPTPRLPWTGTAPPPSNMISPVALGAGPHAGAAWSQPQGQAHLSGYNNDQFERAIFHPHRLHQGQQQQQQSHQSSHSPATTATPPLRPQPRPYPKVAIPRITRREIPLSRVRQRSTRACEPCRARKVKCDGNRPVCRQCIEQRISCAYLDVKRVREQKDLGILGKRVERYEGLLRALEAEVDAGMARRIRQCLKGNGQEQGHLQNAEDEGDSESESSSIGSLEAIDLVEEDLNRSEKTRATGFFGKNSEVAWMQRLENEAQHRSHRSKDDIGPGGKQAKTQDVPIALVSYHLDDLEIPRHEEVDPYAVPPKNEADWYYGAYMEAFHPSFHVVRKKAFTAQYARFIRQPESVRPPRKWLAVLNMIFAIGCHFCHLTSNNGTAIDDDGDGLVFLARARKLSLTGDVLFQHSDLQQVQVEFLVAFYLLARGQVNRASKFSNMAFRSALSLGINLRFVDDWTDHAAKEARSRLWWAIYALEHSIASLTGRVSCASEGLSSVPMPIPYEEESFDNPEVQCLFNNRTLRSKRLKPTLFQTDDESRSHGEWLASCPPTPSLYYYLSVDLVFITQAIINKVYSIDGIRSRATQIEQRIRKYGTKMDNWLAKVPAAYRFTSSGAREASNVETNFFECLARANGDGDSQCTRERFSLAMHFYSAKIMLCRPCLTHANARANLPATDTSGVSFDDGQAAMPTRSYPEAGNGTATGETTGTDERSDSNASTHSGGKESSSSNISNTGVLFTTAARNHRSRFRTEISLSCLRASCALLSLLPNEPDITALLTLSPWWTHLHYIMQATTAMLLGLSSWPTSPPVEEKSATADAPPGKTPSTPTLSAQSVVLATKKALHWLFHMAVCGDDAARRAFLLCDSFMRRIAPSVGVDVGDLPEVAALPGPASKGLGGVNGKGGGLGILEAGVGVEGLRMEMQVDESGVAGGTT